MKLYLLYNNQRISKKKTHVKKRSLNPVFNESFVFDLPKSQDNSLARVQLELVMLDWDRVTKNEVIGKLELGGEECQGSALHHWTEIQVKIQFSWFVLVRELSLGTLPNFDDNIKFCNWWDGIHF